MTDLNDEDRANLVAYLDGELDEKAAQAFEARLSRDQQLRAEAEAMRKTWEMLDYLPRAEPSASFTHRTLERIAVQSLGPAARPGGRPTMWWRWGAVGGWAAAVLLAVAVGVFAAFRLWPVAAPVPTFQQQANQPGDVEVLIVRDLDVIRNKRLYDNADNLDFVRALAEVFDDEEEL